MIRVSAGILTYNRKDAVLRAIESVYQQGVDDVEVVVADSASTDGSAEAIRKCYPKVKVIRLPRNLGCPGGRNHVLANCTGDYIVNLDDDGFLGEGALKRVVEAFDSDPTIGIIAMQQRFIDEPESARTSGDQGAEVGLFRGGVSAFRRAMLDKTGDYPDDFFLFAEEGYLALKAIDAGYRIVSRPDIIMWHPRIGASSGTRWDYYRYRNPLLVVMRLFPGWLMVKYLFLRTASYALLSIRRGSVLQYLRAIGHVLWHLPRTLWTRRPCSAETVRTHFRLRGRGSWGHADTMKTR